MAADSDPIAAIPMRHRDEAAVFPRGWYCVAESHEVCATRLTAKTWLGEPLVVFRDGDGFARAAGAFCPHLGAHLASHDGKLEAGAIVCPFHKWRFDARSGVCVNIPYSDVIPAAAALDLRQTREIDGMVVMWGGGGVPDHEPYANSDVRAEAGWRLHATRQWRSTAPFRDILENLFDTAHVQQLHNAETAPTLDRFEHTAFGLAADYRLNVGAETAPLGTMACRMSGVSLLTQHFDIGGVETRFIHSFTPVDKEQFVQTARFYFKTTGSPDADENVATPWIERFVYEVEQDFKVLNFKKHLTTPVLCKGDGPIYRFRAYAEQFYAPAGQAGASSH